MASKVTPLNSPIIISNSIPRRKDPVLEEEISSIPEPIFMYMQNHAEFQWVFEDGNMYEFVRLNPQFKPNNRVKLTLEQILRIPINNRDGWHFDPKHKPKKGLII